MKVSLTWLNNYVSLKGIKPEELSQAITLRSQEVEDLSPLVDIEEGVTIGEVTGCRPHEEAEKLSVCTVDTGEKKRTIVCGADNVAEGQKVVVALPGAVLAGGMEIRETTIRGVHSEGMICSLSELGIDEKYHQEEGIHVLDPAAPIGSDALEYLAFNDTVLELDLTPNRADLLSMHGVAYEVAAIFGRNLSIPDPELITSEQANTVEIETQTEGCQSYYGRVLEEATIGPSPRWMQARLIAAGIRPINNIVDVTNYVMLETGQPLHAFDYDALRSDRIVVRDAREGESFVTLDEEARTLKAGDVLITDGERPIALGGVMGGLDTEVTSSTRSILLEAATFDPARIRRTSSRLDLKSESSMRFERGVDPQKTRYALDRAAALIAIYASAAVRDGVQNVDRHARGPRDVTLSLNTLNKVLGSNYEAPAVRDVFNRLRFPYDEEDEVFTVHVPSRRQDVNTYQDLIEEVGRLMDYNALPDTLPTTLSIGGLSSRQKLRRHLRRTLSGLGLFETMTYSLRDVSRIDDLTLENGKPVELSKPLSREHHALVRTPLHGMVDVAAYNRARKQESIHLFEIGKQYTSEAERERLGLLMSGPYHHHRWRPTPPTDFFTLKGVIEALRQALNLPRFHYEAITLENYHPHQTARIYCKGKSIGHIGKLHPEYVEPQGLEDVYVAELDIESLEALQQEDYTYAPVSPYPGVRRDIALLVDDDVPAEALKDSLASVMPDRLQSSHVFDVYTGEKIEAGKKSIAIRLTLADPEGTLRSEDVDALIAEGVEALSREHGAQQR